MFQVNLYLRFKYAVIVNMNPPHAGNLLEVIHRSLRCFNAYIPVLFVNSKVAMIKRFFASALQTILPCLVMLLFHMKSVWTLYFELY